MPGTVTSIWGPEKSNKSSLAMTWPRPIRHYDFDMGFERASIQGDYSEMKRLVDAGEITTMELPTPVNISVQRNQPLRGYRELWTAFIQDYLKCLGEGHYQTYVIDTGTQAWSNCHHAYLQELQENQMVQGPQGWVVPQGTKLREKLIPIEYGEPNNRMQAVEQGAKAYGKNLVITHHRTDVYATRLGANGPEEYKTGEFTMDAFRRTANLSDIILKVAMQNIDGVWVPEAEVTLCGMSMNMVGVKFQNPTYEMIWSHLERMRS